MLTGHSSYNTTGLESPLSSGCMYLLGKFDPEPHVMSYKCSRNTDVYGNVSTSVSRLQCTHGTHIWIVVDIMPSFTGFSKSLLSANA